ncbi:MAG: PQQ-binding-like beta-propeller repeat protein [Planctomycetaceae bacterium]
MSVRRLAVAVVLAASMGCGIGDGAGSLSEAFAQRTKPGRAKKAPPKKTSSPQPHSGATGPVQLGDATWPQFLGPGRDNIARDTGLLREWPADGPRLVSTIGGLGVGFSNVALADGTAYTLGTHGAREFVLAFSLETGEKLWEQDIALAYHNDYGDGPRGTPTIDGDRLYALGATGALVCLDRHSGEPVWKKNLVSGFGSKVPRWGLCESVLVDGDRVICTPGGRGGLMVAFDKKSGAVAWKCPGKMGDEPAYASILAVDVEGVRQYVNYTANALIGVNADNGKLLWRDDSSTNGMANCCTAVFADGMLLTASGYTKGASMLKLASGSGPMRAELGYHTNDLKVHHGGLVLVGGHVYGSNDPGILTCIELKTGKVKWKDRSVGKGSLTCADGLLIVRGEEGPLALVDASPTGYKEHGRFTPGDRSDRQAWTYPVVCAGKLFLRDQDILQVYDLRGAGEL